MSNHTGSYMFNEVLKAAAEAKIFERLGREDTKVFLKIIFTVGSDYDCNPGEILDDIGENLGVCYCCQKFDVPLKEGLCDECDAEFN